MLVRAAAYIAGQLGLPSEDREVLAFGLRLLANTLTGFALILVLGFALDALLHALVTMLAAYSVKVFSGGAHSATSRNCLAVTLLVFGPAILVAKHWGSFLDPGQALALVFGVGVLCMAVFWRFAPMEAKGKPFLSERHRLWMKTGTMALLLLWSGFLALQVTWWKGPLAGHLVVAGEAGLLSVALFLTPAGHRAVAWLDRVTNSTQEGGI